MFSVTSSALTPINHNVNAVDRYLDCHKSFWRHGMFVQLAAIFETAKETAGNSFLILNYDYFMSVIVKSTINIASSLKLCGFFLYRITKRVIPYMILLVFIFILTEFWISTESRQ